MNGKNIINVGGLQFEVEGLSIKCRDKGTWDLEILGKERQVAQFGGEWCRPRIIIYDISGKGDFANDHKGFTMNLKWTRDDDAVDDTYVTLFGEGFLVIEAHIVMIRKENSDWHNICLKAFTDLPFDSSEKDVELLMDYDFRINELL